MAAACVLLRACALLGRGAVLGLQEPSHDGALGAALGPSDAPLLGLAAARPRADVTVPAEQIH